MCCSREAKQVQNPIPKKKEKNRTNGNASSKRQQKNWTNGNTSSKRQQITQARNNNYKPQGPRSNAQKRSQEMPNVYSKRIPRSMEKKCGLSVKNKAREEYKYAMNRALKKARVSFKTFKIRLEQRQFGMTPDEYVDELIAHGFGKQKPSARQRVLYVNKVMGMGRHKYEQSDEDSEEPNFEPKQVSDDEDIEDLELKDLLTLPKVKKEAKKEPLASILKSSAKAIKDVETMESVSVANDMLGCCTHLSKHDLQKALLAMANSKSIMQLAKTIQNTGKVALAWCQNSGKVV